MKKDSKKKNKKIIIGVIIASIILLLGSGLQIYLNKNRLSKQIIISKVEEKHKTLELVTQWISGQGEIEYISKDKNSDIYYKQLEREDINFIFKEFQLMDIEIIKKSIISDDFKEAIFFTCRYPMRWNKTSYWGFYYSNDGERVGFYGQNHYYPKEEEV